MEESDRKESTISTPDPPSKTDQEREKISMLNQLVMLPD